jgi:hypothetical protein
MKRDRERVGEREADDTMTTMKKMIDTLALIGERGYGRIRNHSGN